MTRANSKYSESCIAQHSVSYRQQAKIKNTSHLVLWIYLVDHRRRRRPCDDAAVQRRSPSTMSADLRQTPAISLILVQRPSFHGVGYPPGQIVTVVERAAAALLGTSVVMMKTGRQCSLILTAVTSVRVLISTPVKNILIDRPSCHIN